jgi:hypothetical protein
VPLLKAACRLFPLLKKIIGDGAYPGSKRLRLLAGIRLMVRRRARLNSYI